MASLINGLGGDSGSCENSISRNDDGSSSAIDITSIFENGINLFDSTYNSVYVNTHGNITFDGELGDDSTSSYTIYDAETITFDDLTISIPDIIKLITLEQSVTRLYNALLGRNPDNSGLSYWLDEIEREGDRSGMIVSFQRKMSLSAQEDAVDTYLNTVDLTNYIA